jgi:hypothetical protein
VTEAQEADREFYPSLLEAIGQLYEEARGEVRPVARVEMNLTASGECTYRLYLRGEDEYEGGVFTIED